MSLRRHWVSGVVLAGALILVGTLGAVAVGASGSQNSPHPSWDVGVGVAPADAVTAALDGANLYCVEGGYTSVYAEAATTLQDWRMAEPNNTVGIPARPADATTPVYAIYVSGSCTVNPDGDGLHTFTFTGARVIFDSQGDVLGLAQGVGRPSTSPPFGLGYDH